MGPSYAHNHWEKYAFSLWILHWAFLPHVLISTRKTCITGRNRQLTMVNRHQSITGFSQRSLKLMHAYLQWDVVPWLRIPWWRHQMEPFPPYEPFALCGEFPVARWIPLTKASDAELWCFLWFTPELINRTHYDVTVIQTNSNCHTKQTDIRERACSISIDLRQL